MNLYKKYRPTTLEQVKGNENTITTLSNLLKKESPPQVYLFHGPSGCGKTTLGRITAKELGCSDNDFIELNSANFRGIDTVREIIQNSQYKPISGHCRVWLVDEAHKLTDDAQNAALKLFEDPPSHAYFILCTTKPNKIIAEIHRRCQVFKVDILNDIQLIGVLRRVVREEGQALDKEVYEQIVNSSFGQPGNALQILEQVLTLPREKQLEGAKRAAEQVVQSIELCRALIKGARWKEISVVLKGLKEQDSEGIRRQVMGYCQTVLLNEDSPRAGLIMEQFADPFYNNGFSDLVLKCYIVTKTK